MTDFQCDLHLHSTFSDGSVSPEGLLRHAGQIGLSVVAITDHDNANGARAALPLAGELGLELIPAIELTARWDACAGAGDVDVLGYFVDLDDPGLRAVERAALADIQGRIALCCARLTAAGYPVPFAAVQAQNPRYAGGRQLRAVLVERGHAGDEDDAARLFAEHWRHVRRARFTIGEQIAAIQRAGGVAILAHPDAITCGGAGWLAAEQIARLVDLGLDGIEVYHRAMSAEARTHFLRLAQQFNLLVSGGSDEHGWSPDLPYMGQEPVTRAMVEAIRQRHRARTGQADAAGQLPPPEKWLMVRSSALLALSAASDYTCYGRQGVPRYGAGLPSPPDEPSTLDVALTVRAPDGTDRLGPPVGWRLKVARKTERQQVWSGYDPLRHVQVVWVWDFYRIQSHVVLRVALPPKDVTPDATWQAALDAFRVIQPGDEVLLDVVSAACGDFRQQHPLPHGATEWSAS